MHFYNIGYVSQNVSHRKYQKITHLIGFSWLFDGLRLCKSDPDYGNISGRQRREPSGQCAVVKCFWILRGAVPDALCRR